MIRSLWAKLVFLVLVLSVGVFVAFPVLALDIPEPVGYVSDFADIFSSEFETSLETDLSLFEQETTNEIAVVTIDGLQETTIGDFAVRLFEEWEIGKKEEDNGLLLLIAPNERELRIEVGYGLEPVITDSRAGRIIRNEITPKFKESDYEGGVSDGVLAIKDYITAGEPVYEEEAVVDGEDRFGTLMVFFFVLIYLAGFWGRSKRVWPGGIVGAILGTVANAVVGGIIWIAVMALFGFFLDALFSRNYKTLKKRGKSTSWWSSGGGFFSGGGGRSSGGGGFGGFSGGSSGGGGASGSW